MPRPRPPALARLGLLVLALLVASGGVPTAQAAGRRGSTDPATRIAALGALVADQDADATAADRDVATLTDRLVALQRAEGAARARTDELSVAATAAQIRLADARAALRMLAVAAYRDGARPQDLLAIVDARAPMDAIYRQHLVARSAQIRRRAIVEARRAERAAVVAVEAARAARDRIRRDTAAVQARLPAARQRAETARRRATLARFWLARWRSVEGGVGTAIRGQPVLGSEEMARWFAATRGSRNRTTVPMAELARFYVEEGSAENVRSDIAFAQSILETASFRFPDGGQVAPSDNNFAGMDACDSCERGSRFPDARTGVRAQMQLLRVYAQPGLRNSMLGNPAVNPRLDTHYLKGRVPTWGGLTRTWATAAGYGDRIIEIYCEMLAWLTDRADLGA
ncbi:MAG: glucosaminidase domain-containing protein [Actinomycetes bacterium]